MHRVFPRRTIHLHCMDLKLFHIDVSPLCLHVSVSWNVLYPASTLFCSVDLALSRPIVGTHPLLH